MEESNNEIVNNIDYYINTNPPNSTDNIPLDTTVMQNTYLNFGHVNPVNLNTHGELCPGPFYPDNNMIYNGITSSEDLFNNNNSELFKSSEVKEIKEKVLEIFLKKSDFEDSEYDELNYENEEIDDFSKKVDEYNKEFKVVQQEVETCEENLKKEIKIMNENLKKLDHFIQFVDKLDKTIDEEDKEGLLSQINKISKKLSKPDNFVKAKKDYVESRKKLLKYIYLFKKINKWNIANMCGICLEKPVDHFIDPCGHTFCEGCIKEQFRVDSIEQIKLYAERNNLKCPICRFCPVNTAKPLYFL